MSDDDLRINTLHRFAKHSPRLTLQEYSHCEVPAGCGGVVLRWIDPAAGPRVRVRIIAIGAVDTWLDGRPLSGDRALLGPGRHVLTLHFTSLGRMPWRGRDLALPAPVPFALGLYSDQGPRLDAANQLPNATGVVERWAPGPFEEPPIAPDFDDRAWRTLLPVDDAALAALPDDVRPTFRRASNDTLSLRSIGEAGTKKHDAWARVSFELDAALLEQPR